jgi:hypothetical protein
MGANDGAPPLFAQEPEAIELGGPPFHPLPRRAWARRLRLCPPYNERLHGIEPPHDYFF